MISEEQVWRTLDKFQPLIEEFYGGFISIIVPENATNFRQYNFYTRNCHLKAVPILVDKTLTDVVLLQVSFTTDGKDYGFSFKEKVNE